MEINKNVKKLIDLLKLTPYEFSKSIGNNRADNIYNIINEKVEISPKTLNKILKKYPEYREFIISGKEDSLIIQKAISYLDTTSKSPAEIFKYTEIPDSIILDYIEKVKDPTLIHAYKLINYFENMEESEMLKESIEKELINEGVNYVSLLPLSAAAGSLTDFSVSVKKNDCEKIKSPIDGADWAITISGDSMAPEYLAGALILIKKINENAFIEWGKVHVLDTCNGTVVKILVPSEKNGYVKCVSINPEPRYASFDVSFDDIYGIYRVLMCMSVK